MYLDNRHRIIDVAELFHGTIDGASVHPRVVVQQSLQLNAAAIIFTTTTRRESPNQPCGRGYNLQVKKPWRWLMYGCLIISWLPPVKVFRLRPAEFYDGSIILQTLPGKHTFPTGKRKVRPGANPTKEIDDVKHFQ